MKITRITKATGPGAQHLRQILSWGLPAVITISYLILALQSDLGLAFPTLIGVTSVIIMVLAVILYAGERGAIDWSPTVILLVSVVLRTIFLFRPPDLSDDIYRYIWDGLLVLNGQNPYSAVPSNMQPPNDASHYLLRMMNHPDFATIYPPGAQLIFAAGAYLGDSFRGLKVVLVLMDSISCALIIKLLSHAGLPSWRAVLYAWHPVPILEIGSSGHIDGAGVLFLLLTIALLRAPAGARSIGPGPPARPEYFPKRPVFLAASAGLAFSWAALVKLFPLLFLPGIFMLVGKNCRVVFLTGVLAGACALTLPFLPDLKNMFTTLDTYLRNWEFAGLAFRTLRRITSSGDSARLVLACFFQCSAAAIFGALWFGTYPIFRRGSRDGSSDSQPGLLPPALDKDYFLAVMKTLYFITMAFLFLTPTLHPWYALYLVCFLPFTPGVGGLVLSATIFLPYIVLIPHKLFGLWVEGPYTPAVIWLAPASAVLLLALTRKPREHRHAVERRP
ncbi:MAG: hypothetical protein WAW37_00530 [Syntrophobacteraceae bacterium]